MLVVLKKYCAIYNDSDFQNIIEGVGKPASEGLLGSRTSISVSGTQNQMKLFN